MPQDKSENIRGKKSTINKTSSIAFIARLKVDRFYDYLHKNWDKLVLYLDFEQIKSILDKDSKKANSKNRSTSEVNYFKDFQQKLSLKDRFSADLFHLMSGVHKYKISLTENDVDRAEKIISDLREDIVTQIETSSWQGSTSYTDVTNRLQKLFTGEFKWYKPKGKDRYEWVFNKTELINHERTSGLTLSESLQTNLPKYFAGTNWYLYLNINDGSQRMILSIEADRNQEGLYPVTIIESDSENSSYQGTVFSNSHDRHKQLILLLRHLQSGAYAHLILFIEGDRRENQTLFNGHFTYFASKVKKYITKSVLLHYYPSKQKDMMLPVRIVGKLINTVTEDEKLIMRYLNNRNQNRLTSIGDPPQDISALEAWLRRHTKDPDILLSYAKKYHVFYVKKRTKPVEQYEFFRDELILSCSPFPQDLRADYTHYSSKGSNDLTAERETGYSYGGRANFTAGYLFGLLTSTDNFPLYILMHTPPKKDNGGNEYFLGSVSAEADKESVNATYTCIVVPFSILNNKPDNARNEIDRIENKLKHEANTGWGTVDPSQEIARKFKLSDL